MTEASSHNKQPDGDNETGGRGKRSGWTLADLTGWTLGNAIINAIGRQIPQEVKRFLPHAGLLALVIVMLAIYATHG